MYLRDSYNDYVQSVVIKVGRLDLGNNFSYGHFIDALSSTIKDSIYDYSIDLDANIRIIGEGIYGKCVLDTCASDLFDYIK